MRRSLSFITCMLALLSAMVLGLPRAARAQGDQQVYTDALSSSWQNWSWCATDLSSHDYVHGGTASIKATITAAWQALYFHCDPTSGTLYSNLTFWINGGAVSGRNLEISGLINNTSQGNVSLNQFISGGSVAANTWRKVTVPLSSIGLAKTSAMTGFWVGDASGGAQAAFYVDDITLVGVNSAGGPVTITIDASANRHPIDPHVYGLAYASQDNLTDLNISLNRLGGNATTRYNWQQNASNRASDYYFESIAEATATPGDAVDAYITSGFNANAQTMVTIPTIGWVANLGPNRGKTASFSRAKYGAQTSYDYWWSDAGNGIATSGQFVTGNDPNDANTPADSTFQQKWVKHIVNQYGQASKGGVAYYILDNEPSIWHSTHRDVHPTGATMDEIKGKVLDYAAKIKAVDADAQIVGPEEWGWSGYLYSGYDQQYGGANGWGYLPDRSNHGGADYMPWLLDQLHQYDTTNKTKSLDVFSLHYYPQGGEFGNDTSTAMQLRRNRSTRSLWDPNYTDETWINDKVQLIPRMKKWVSDNYAGLKTALTEYNWGAEGHINGATTQADILGIFGREGLDMAARWTTPDPSTPTYKAFKLYRNPDGSNKGFGDTSVSDIVPDADTLSSFAAVRSSDGALTIMLINKSLTDSAKPTLNAANFAAGNTAKLWQLTSDNTLSRLSDVTVTKPTIASVSLALTVPAQSITLVVIPKSASGTQGAITGLFNTGVDANGNAATQGAADAHWTLVNTPSGSSGTAYIATQNWLGIAGAWMADSSTSQWLAPTPDVLKVYQAVGNYTWQTTFTVTGDPNAVELNGKLLADNSISAVILNGKTLLTNVAGYNTWGSFTLSSGFVSGTNTLQVIVNNSGSSANPTGFRAEFNSPKVTSTLTGLFNTGVDANGNAATQGAADAHWTLVNTPSGSSGTAYIATQNWLGIAGAWMADSSTSQWLAPTPDVLKVYQAVGNYTWQTTFTVTGDPSAVKITGQVAGDNSVTAIILNGTTYFTNVVGYNTWGSFTLSSGFVSGTNTLQVIVNNSGTSANPTGFRAEVTGGSQ